MGAKVPRNDSYRGVIQKAPLSTVFMKKDAQNNAVGGASSAGITSGHQKSASVSMLNTYREHHQQQLVLQQQQQQQLLLQQQMLEEHAAHHNSHHLHHHHHPHQNHNVPSAAGSSLPSNSDPMDDLMEIDFTSSSATSSVEAGGVGCACGGRGAGGTGTMDLDDVCDLPVDISHSSSSPLVKSQPMSVPQARKFSDDHHPGHQMPASRGIDPPNGYVPMRPSLKTAGGGGSAASSIGHDVPPPQPLHQQQHISMPLASSAGSTGSGSSYMCMKPVGASPVNHHPSNASFSYHHHHHHQLGAGSPQHSNPMGPPTPMTPTAPTAPHIVMAKLNTKRGSIGNNNSSRSMAPVNNSNSDYLTMSPSQEHMLHPTPVAVPAATAILATTVAATNVPEGYMEMKWIKPTDAVPTNTNINNNNHFNASAALSPPQTARLSSQPININHPARNSSAASVTSTSASAAELNNERKHHGSLSLAVKTRVRCDSKDSGIMTPTGSHTSIFPFSPSSPKTAFAVSAGSSQPTASAAAMMSATANRKCMIDATNGTVHLATVEPQSSAGGCDPSAVTARPTCTGIDQPKVQNKDQTPMQVDTLSNDYADMTLGPKQQHASSSAALAAAVAAAAATGAAASSTAVNSATRKTSNLQSRPLQLSSARETTNADYTLMKPSYPYPKKKPLLVQINNNLTNATTKTNATAFRPIAADSVAQRQRSPVPVAPAVAAASSATSATATASPASPSYAPYEMLIARPNSVAQEKVSAVKPQNNTPMMRSSSANSDRLRLSPSVGSSAGSCATVVTASSSAATSSSSSTSTLCGDTAMPASRPTQQQPHHRPASLAAVLAAVQRASSLSDATEMDACSGSSSPAPMSVTSRPPSVSSERELYYASLDLPAAAAAAAAATAAAAAGTSSAATDSSDASASSAATTPNSKPVPGAAAAAPATAPAQAATSSPSSATAAAPAFSYAQIDFMKCEQAKTNATPQSAANATNAVASAAAATATATAAVAASLKATAIVTSAVPQ